MKKLIIVLIVNLIVITGFSQTKNFIDQPYIETRTKVDTLVSPDRIYLNIFITEKDTKGKISVEELENKMAVKLDSLGVDLQKQLTLSDLASNFKKYFLKKQDILKNKAFSLVVYNAQTAGKVMLELELIGISNVQFIKAEYSKIEELKLNLKIIAIRKAKKQAEALLQPLNQKLGSALHISDISSSNYGMKNRNVNIQFSYKANESQSYEPINIDFQKIKVQSEINIKFKIE